MFFAFFPSCILRNCCLHAAWSIDCGIRFHAAMPFGKSCEDLLMMDLCEGQPQGASPLQNERADIFLIEQHLFNIKVATEGRTCHLLLRPSTLQTKDGHAIIDRYRKKCIQTNRTRRTTTQCRIRQ